MNRRVSNMAASVRQRLLNLSRERREDFGLLLTKYGLERVLYRIAQSKHREMFVLKGALLFELWTEQRYRPTRDADFLARGQNTPEKYVELFKEICNIDVESDGLTFDETTVAAERITEDADYEGVRVRFLGFLENARIPIQIDLGFGDVITPAPIEAQLPTLLDLPAPKLLTYPRESVIAEKFEALVSLGIANSRMKDLHDIQTLSRQFPFDGPLLAEALANTLERRGTKLPDRKPLAFTEDFFNSEDKKKQWAAFCEKNKSYVEESTLKLVCQEIEVFLAPVLNAVASNTRFTRKWTRETAWR
jgi:Nucleotidyl transferase AbiEii toxin, Type IV TA system